MDNMKNTKYPEQLKELFRAFAPEELYNAWADTFEVESVDGKRVVIAYHGSQTLSAFKKECKKTLGACVDSLLGDGKKMKLVKKSSRSSLSPKAKKNIRALKFFTLGIIFVCIATAVIVVLLNYIGNRNFRETFYNTSSIKVDSRVRVIQLSDLHCASYGKDNAKLLKRIEALHPDIIICTGDIVDSVEDDADFTVALAGKLAEIAPSYYVYGNKEVESIYGFPFNEADLDRKFGFDDTNRDESALPALEDPFEEQLEAVGIKVLKNESDTITVDTMTVDVYGVLNSNPSSFWSYSEKAFFDYLYTNPDNLKITAIHEPLIFEEFQPETWGDLILCGHTHGGVVRIPVLGPLYTHEHGLFPERSDAFVYGRYDAAGTPLIVSSGLENTDIFRINNQPELVVIDINKF
ncbi:MAG: hypothetical protein E7471_03760 [Ruminococcaceae bacterium]|nr:hypothetical protein [Oscillospiraceae bacterium]